MSNPVTIYFNSLEEAAEWASNNPQVSLTVWGKTLNGKKYRASFVLRKEDEEAEQPTVPAV